MFSTKTGFKKHQGVHVNKERRGEAEERIIRTGRNASNRYLGIKCGAVCREGSCEGSC